MSAGRFRFLETCALQEWASLCEVIALPPSSHSTVGSSHSLQPVMIFYSSEVAAHAAKRGVAPPSAPAPSMLKMCPPVGWSRMTRIACRKAPVHELSLRKDHPSTGC